MSHPRVIAWQRICKPRQAAQSDSTEMGKRAYLKVLRKWRYSSRKFGGQGKRSKQQRWILQERLEHWGFFESSLLGSKWISNEWLNSDPSLSGWRLNARLVCRAREGLQRSAFQTNSLVLQWSMCQGCLGPKEQEFLDTWQNVLSSYASSTILSNDSEGQPLPILLCLALHVISHILHRGGDWLGLRSGSLKRLQQTTLEKQFPFPQAQRRGGLILCDLCGVSTGHRLTSAHKDDSCRL